MVQPRGPRFPRRHGEVSRSRSRHSPAVPQRIPWLSLIGATKVSSNLQRPRDGRPAHEHRTVRTVLPFGLPARAPPAGGAVQFAFRLGHDGVTEHPLDHPRALFAGTLGIASVE